MARTPDLHHDARYDEKNHVAGCESPVYPDIGDDRDCCCGKYSRSASDPFYPISFLITDLTNRHFGPDRARKVVVAGFFIGVILSFALATPRIALASGLAFLFGQLLDIGVFNRLRRLSWWRAPLIGSVVGSAVDTALFFSIAFYGIEAMSVPVQFFGAITMPLWVSLGTTDFLVKVAIALVALLPYGALLKVVTPVEDTRTQPSA
jgi:uncharacterized PurR-regulated membrane protein YhhQ (DUF165 family)